jgi:RNA polymerase sigma-70 factor (ECF subfamily)
MATFFPEPPRSLLTRASLIFRLRDWNDGASWTEFYRLYRRLIYNLGCRAGLSHDEAEDVVQDVFKRVAETIGSFECHPRRGSFRSWLMTLTRWRVADKFRDRLPESPRLLPRWDSPTLGSSGSIEQLPSLNLEDDPAWEMEWQRNILASALERLARRVPAKHFQAFDLYARQRWPVTRVARDLGLNTPTVYLISHRLTRQLRSEVERLKAQLG